MNKCLCIDHDIYLSNHNRISACNCNFKCGGSSDNIYLDDCGGENAYNIYGTQRGILFILWRELICLHNIICVLFDRNYKR